MTLTMCSMLEPAASRIAARLAKVCRTCSEKLAGCSSRLPRAGICPAVNTRWPLTTAWE
ncbi:hypothetical protein D9M68_910860 [compost metagenome]